MSSVFSPFFAGLADALALQHTFVLLYYSKSVSDKFFECLKAGGIFLMMVVVMEYMLLPAIRWLADSLLGWSGGAGLFLRLTYMSTWFYPALFLITILNLEWYQDIANAAYEHLAIPVKELAWHKVARDALFRLLMGVLLLVQCQVPLRVPDLVLWLLPGPGGLLGLVHVVVPYLGACVAFLFTCWSLAFYFFEYKWGLDGLELRAQIASIEERWPYFLGFGTPASAVYFAFMWYLDKGVADGLLAIIYPIFILQALQSSPHRHPKMGRHPFLPRRLPFFFISSQFATWCVQKMDQNRKGATTRRRKSTATAAKGRGAAAATGSSSSSSSSSSS